MPSIEKRGDKYRIMVSMGYDSSGRQIRKTTTFIPPENVTSGKAEKLATAFAFDFEKTRFGMVDLDENAQFKNLYDWYMTAVAKQRMKPISYVDTERMFENYILPFIGKMKLKDITTPKIDLMFAKLRESGGSRVLYKLKNVNVFPNGSRKFMVDKLKVSYNAIDGLAHGKTTYEKTARKISEGLNIPFSTLFEVASEKGALSINTIKRVRSSLSPLFNTAVKKGLILKNPVINATIPIDFDVKPDFLPDMDYCKKLAMTFEKAENVQMGRILSALLFSGMRVGELLALHWADVDFSDSSLFVKYTLYRLDNGFHLSSPKTRASKRVICMPPQLVRILKEQKVWQENRKKELGNKWVNKDIVFTSSLGNYMDKGCVNSYLHKLLRKNGLMVIRTHQLRHLNASLLINMNVPVKVVSEHLGHSNTQTTELIYAHMFEKTMKVAADAINAALSSF